MKFGVSKEALAGPLERVFKLLPSSKAVPMLAFARFEAQESGELSVSATDLVASIRIRIPGVLVQEPGVCLMGAGDILAMIRSSASTAMGFVTSEGGVTIFGGKNVKWFHKTLPVEDYPKIPTLEESVVYTLPRADLLTALRSVRPACADLAFKANLGQIGLRKGKVQAADGLRFHEVALLGTDLLDTAIPREFLDDLISLLAGSSEDTVDLGVTADSRHLIFHSGSVTLSTARKTEDFPDVGHAFLIPALSHDITLTAKRRSLIDAVRRVRLFADEQTKAVRFALTRDFTSMEISARQRGGSWAREVLAVDWPSGQQRSLVFQHEFLLHLLGLFDTETVTLRMGPDTKHRPSSVLIQEGDRSGVLTQLRLDWMG